MRKRAGMPTLNLSAMNWKTAAAAFVLLTFGAWTASGQIVWSLEGPDTFGTAPVEDFRRALGWAAERDYWMTVADSLADESARRKAVMLMAVRRGDALQASLSTTEEALARCRDLDGVQEQRVREERRRGRRRVWWVGSSCVVGGLLAGLLAAP